MEDSWIQSFKDVALPVLISEFKPERVIIFGSRITGKAHEDSDIDVIVVADSFRNVPFIKRMPMMLRKTPFEKHVDYICYTPVEFKRIKSRSSILIDALETGERVA